MIKMRTWTIIHKWVGLIIGLQIVLWIAGGVVMSVIPIDTVRGQYLVSSKEINPPAHTVTIDLADYKTVSHGVRQQQAFLTLTDWQGQVHYVDATTGEVLEPLSVEQITAVAKARFTQQPVNVASTDYLTTLPLEADHLGKPVFRVTFDDWRHTSFYLDPITADVLTVRSDIWRFYDFFWMLHIMDYDLRRDFNHPLLILSAFSALFVAVSGLLLVYTRVIKPIVIEWQRLR